MSVTISAPALDIRILELEEQHKLLQEQITRQVADRHSLETDRDSPSAATSLPDSQQLRAELSKVEGELNGLKEMRQTIREISEQIGEQALHHKSQDGPTTSLIPPDRTLDTALQIEESDKEQKRELKVAQHDLGEQQKESAERMQVALKQESLTHTPHELPVAELGQPTDPASTALLYAGMGVAALATKAGELFKEHGDDLAKGGAALWEAAKALDFNRDRAMSELAHAHRNDVPSLDSQMMEVAGKQQEEIYANLRAADAEARQAHQQVHDQRDAPLPENQVLEMVERHQAERLAIDKESGETQRRAEQADEKKYERLRNALEGRIKDMPDDSQKPLRTALEERIKQDQQLVADQARQARIDEIERMRRQHEREARDGR